jgi:hypothetical protein
MRFLLIVIFLFLCSSPSYGQTIFKYSYREICTEQVRSVQVDVSQTNDTFTVFFFGESETFDKFEMHDGTYHAWMVRVNKLWNEYYPCAEIQELVAASSKRVAEGGEVELGAPLLVLSSDLAYFSPYEFRAGSGYSTQNLKTGLKYGASSSFGNSQKSALGYYRMKPIGDRLSRVESFGGLYIEGDFLGNLFNGVYYRRNKMSTFLFNSVTFGILNNYRFQDTSLILGISNKLYSNPYFSISSTVVFSYIYYVKVFKLSYWFEDHVKLNSNLSLTWKLSPTFGLNLATSINYRSDSREFSSPGVLLGAKYLF